MIGQKVLVDKFNNYTLQTLPKSILLIGESGCGKHTLATYISVKLNLDLIDLATLKDSGTDIIDYQQNTIPHLFLIDLDNYIEKFQNQFLKMIEEPSDNSYIILTASSKANILPTVLSRCTIFYFEAYSLEELKQIKNDLPDFAYFICKTPGQLLNAYNKQLDKIYDFGFKFIENIITFADIEALSYFNFFNYKDNLDKFDINLFINTIQYIVYNKYLQDSSNQALYNLYLYIKSYIDYFKNKSISKEYTMTSFLLNIKIKGYTNDITRI